MSDCLTLENGEAVLKTDEGQTINFTEEELMNLVKAQFQPPINGAAFPDGLKFQKWVPPFLMLVHQEPPMVRRYRWIANDSEVPNGPSTKYRSVRISTPYCITFAVFSQTSASFRLSGSNELYFRKEPLKDKNDGLCMPALLNMSKMVSDYCESENILNVVLFNGGNEGVDPPKENGTFGNAQVYLKKQGADLTAPITRFHPEIAKAEFNPSFGENGCGQIVDSVPQILFAILYDLGSV